MLEVEEEPAQTLARPQLFPSVPRAWTPKLVRGRRGLDVLSGVSTPASIQALTTFLGVVGLGIFLFWGCFCGRGRGKRVLIPTSNSATAWLDKERRLFMGFMFLHSILCRQEVWKSPLLRSSFCFLKNVPWSRFSVHVWGVSSVLA